MKKMKNWKFFEKWYFFDENFIFEKIEKSKILKISHFVKDFNTKFVLKSLTKCENFKIFDFSFFRKYFFHRKNEHFSKIFSFHFFNRISCPTHASGIAQLPLCRPWTRQTLSRKSGKFWKYPIFFVNCIDLC